MKLCDSVITGVMSPEAAATLFTLIQASDFHRPQTPEAKAALREVQDIGRMIAETIGIKELNRLIEELGL